ncbi:hypothetical protein [Actinomyces qiguomingii]|uniref:hypothetical protein n=1 Tax=Actinomyces qiguomingii TaxID=2057800 RepID=UPI000CA05D22|nr:hypothetical protein [Actinomyces qiguomingii]
MRIAITVQPDIGQDREYTADVPAEPYDQDSVSDVVAAQGRERRTAAAVLAEIADYISHDYLPDSPDVAPGRVEYYTRYLHQEPLVRGETR